MRKAPERVIPARDRRTDLLIWVSLLLSPLAMGVNTIVGYTVAHWVCDVDRKKTAFIVSAVDLVLTLGALWLAFALDRSLPAADEGEPHPGRRHFMTKVAMLLAGIAILLVMAQTLAIITLRPCD